jgi:UDP-glucose 4-epimerase
VAAHDVVAIIHLASLNEHDSINNIKLSWDSNTLGTHNLLSLLSNKQIPQFICFSTFHVYVGCTGRIVEDSTTRPHHPYASTHRAAEDIVSFYQCYKSMDSFRLSKGFGYPMDSGVKP